MTIVSDFPPGEEVGDILDHFEQRVMVVVPGDLASGHRVTSDHPALQPPPNCQRGGDFSDRGQASLARRSAQFDDHMEHWVRSLTRAGLVERALSVAGGSEEDLVKLVPCLPSLAILQVNKNNDIKNMHNKCFFLSLQGIVSRCGLIGEVLSRVAPSYLGQIAAIFHKNEKAFKSYKVLNN